ncbi:hypothetical protein B0H16DRAFT_1338682 [Mycena metata]|uniref:CxC2-like cysteine cluster KDZ transposase-associated domain-containing protein n=1 Tax=Mycena metata TaxID=1033252 RepID=A0AAD7HBS3_9AGAR|nr:hypothetical protein B0H16DRAFT_1338682 [Mycena metata]
MRYTDKFTSSALVSQGFFPCAPWNPSLAFSTRLLELFHVAHLRTPQLSIQAWMKTIADLHGAPFKPYHAQQFSIAYDVFSESLENVDTRVMHALGWDGPDWRLTNCCSGCMYKLEGEEELEFSMLVTMDGNDSLKRVLRKEAQDFDEDGNLIPGEYKERFDPRTAPLGRTTSYPGRRSTFDAPPQPAPTRPAPEAVAGAASGCEERWKNLADDSSKRTWAIYDETGVFVCLCRHGFILLVADMVRSGELSKYALSVCNELIKAFPAGLGNGYDIGCGSSSTIWNSPLGAKALLAKFRLLVGAFHGHAHNRLCQLLYLATYVFGLGLEDLEGCERFFSRSNALATSVQYASIFHRKQTLAFFKHFEAHETYANLSKFLVNNYWQALDILAGEPMFLSAMQLAGITDLNEFPKRLDQEFTFLKSLMGDSEEDTLQMEYYQRLVNFTNRRWVSLCCLLLCVELILKLELVKKESSKSSRTVIRHAQENYDKAYAEVQESEIKMGVVDRWEDTSPEWAEAAHLVSTKRYRLAVLKLERLVVQRMFELTKMNLSQTGYKLRKHIAKALQVRSQAIRNALKSYNTAAKSMVPPARQLRWDEVIEYAFLSDFDLLRKLAELSEVRPWASPTARVLLDKYFKIQRAQEEIQWCNIEIRRVITSIRDEKIFLMAKEDEVRQSNPGLAWCIQRYRFRRERYNLTHMQRFQDLAKKAGERFTGTLEPGVRLSKVVPTSPMEGVLDPSREAAEREAQEIARQMEESGDRDEELEIDDDLGERIEEEQLDTIYLASEDT